MRDNAPNMVNAMQLIGWKGAGCFLHNLQFVVTHSIFEQSGVKSIMARASKLVSYFKHSPKAMYILHKHQTALEGQDIAFYILRQWHSIQNLNHGWQLPWAFKISNNCYIAFQYFSKVL